MVRPRPLALLRGARHARAEQSRAVRHPQHSEDAARADHSHSVLWGRRAEPKSGVIAVQDGLDHEAKREAAGDGRLRG
eukprot:scaffold76270_cov45-Phaeocystis_antarctica.AAC.2